MTLHLYILSSLLRLVTLTKYYVWITGRLTERMCSPQGLKGRISAYSHRSENCELPFFFWRTFTGDGGVRTSVLRNIRTQFSLNDDPFVETPGLFTKK